MDTKNISQNINELKNTVDTEVDSGVDSEDYLQVLNEEQEAFEQGVIEDDEPIVEMEEEDINQQTIEFLKLRGKKQA